MKAILSNLHTHSVYSDGQNTMEEMVQRAVSLGLESIGISDHAYAPYDPDCSIPAEKMDSYRREIFSLREAYKDVITVYAGLEVDALHLHHKAEWDYVIGSAHYVKGKRGYHAIDYTARHFEAAVEDFGSGRAVIEAYGEALIELAMEYRPHILGHLDIFCKLMQRGEAALDLNAPWYRDMWLEITRKIAESGCIVEVNTSAIYRGHSHQPYPSAEILRMLRDREVPVTISSDAHQAEFLTGAFPEAVRLLREIGYSSIRMLKPRGFVDTALP